MGKNTCGDDVNKLNTIQRLLNPKSMKEYREVNTRFKLKYGNNAKTKILGHIKMRIKEQVATQNAKWKRDAATFVAGSVIGTAVPYAGVPVMLAAVVYQFVQLEASLGLIPVINVRSPEDIGTLILDLVDNVMNSASDGKGAAIQKLFSEISRLFGIERSLWDEAFAGFLSETTSNAANGKQWIKKPFSVINTYRIHRKMVTKMNHVLGKKAILVHTNWVNDHLL